MVRHSPKILASEENATTATTYTVLAEIMHQACECSVSGPTNAKLRLTVGPSGCGGEYPLALSKKPGSSAL